MRKLHSVVAEAVASYLAHHDGVLPIEVLDHLLSTAREELAVHYETAFRKGLLSIIREALKSTSLDDGVASGEPTQLPLPGMKAPTTLPILQSSGEYRYVRFEKLTGKEFLLAMETRRVGITHDQARLDDLESKWSVLRRYLLTNDTMTVADALRLLADEQRPNF